MANIAVLVLASGKTYIGKSFGGIAPTLSEFSALAEVGDAMVTKCNYFAGELVFNTAMSGYVEVLSDPSFSGQIVCMTYPHIGNYGVDLSWIEAASTDIQKDSPTPKSIMVSGLIVRKLYEGPVPEGRITLSKWMQLEGIVGISDIDTRSLTLYIRDAGAQNAAMLLLNSDNMEQEIAQAVMLLNRLPSMEGRDIVSQIELQDRQITQRYASIADLGNMPALDYMHVPQSTEAKSSARLKIGILDYGCKQNIIRLFEHRDCKISLISQHNSLEQIVSANYNLILVSNGPGDPAVLSEQLALLKSLIGKTVLCGICLGTQLLALSIGASTYKMTFGHHGINHPVRDERTKRLYITSQNHGFAVDEATLPADAEVWFRNTNDNSLEGFSYSKKKLYSVQFHPEAAPGPTDTLWIIDYFLEKAREHGRT